MAWPLRISECQCWVGLQTVPVTTLNPASGNRSTLYQTTKPGLAPSLWLTVNSPPAQSQQCCYSVSQLNGYYTPLCVFIWLWQVNYWTSLCHEDNWPVKPLWNLIHLLHFITTLHLLSASHLLQTACVEGSARYTEKRVWTHNQNHRCKWLVLTARAQWRFNFQTSCTTECVACVTSKGRFSLK